MQKRVEEIIEQAALKFNLPKQVIQEIHDSQPRFTRNIIRECRKNGLEDSLPTIMWPKWGKYYPHMLKHNRIKDFIIKNNGETSAEDTQE